MFKKGHLTSNETREKISKSRKGKRSGIDHPFYGRHHTEEAKLKNKEAHTGKNNANYGKHHSEETKRKISEAQIGKEKPSSCSIDIAGQKLGRWTVIKKVGYDKHRSSMWLCRCDCGTERNVCSKGLVDGTSKSCGCLREELQKTRQCFVPSLATMRQVIRIYKAHAKQRELEWSITEEQFAEITQKDCYYCGAIPNNVSKSAHSNGDYRYNGIDRMDNDKGYTMDNIVPCCHTCNQAKSKMSSQEYKDWIKRSYDHLFKESYATNYR